MKKVLCLIISLSLVFGAILPVYAVDEVQLSAIMNPNGGTAIGAYSAYFNIFSALSALNTIFTGSVGTMYNSVSELMSWLTPVGSFNTSHSISGVTLYEIVDYIAWTLSGVGPTVYQTFQDIATSVTNTESFISSSTSYLSSLALSLSRQTQNANNLETTMHSQLGNPDDAGYNYGWYRAKTIRDLGVTNTTNYQWQKGTPLGNIALLLQHIANSQADIYHYNWIASLTHYADTLTTWDHSTHTQVSFTPESLTQGLYRYLAYIQSDTSSLFYSLLNNFGSVVNYTYSVSTGASTSFTASSLGHALLTIMNNQSGLISNLNFNLTRQYVSALNSAPYNKLYTPGSMNEITLNSTFRGIQSWLPAQLSMINLGTSRLAYVLANDEEIAARASAKDDQNSVVNNFVAPTGSATASPSDYASVSQASTNFKSNFNTGVASSGIWDTFSNNHYSWFTQDTANSLDTVSASTRGSYDTPLLDNYYHEILGYFNNNRRNEDTAYDYVGNFIEEFNSSREIIEEEVVER